ncbi:MAG TPA: cytochrome P450 [Blastocatellia bacterium]|nr:cytochrome P450 [Blastocatellia bacterium]
MAKTCPYSLDEIRDGTPESPHSSCDTPPSPGGLPFLGSLLEVKRDRLGFLEKLQAFGDVVVFRMGPKSIYFVNCPAGVRRVLRDNYRNYRKGVGLTQAKPLIGNGLLTSEGLVWQRQRRMARPSFEPASVGGYAAAITSAIEVMFGRWDLERERKSPINMFSEMSRLTLDILVRCLFGADFVYRAETVERAFGIATQHAIHRMTSLFEFTARLPTPRNLRFSRAVKDLEEVVQDLITNRRDATDKAPDLLTELLHARDESGAGMSDKQLRDEVMTILLAGHETTACTLTWVWYLLAKNPVASKKLKLECDVTLQSHPPTTSDLPKFNYANMVLRETMRLYPAVWLIPRKAINADVIEGFTIPQGADVLISPYTLHRHPSYWQQSQEFWPERFEAIINRGRDPDVYLPFGAGPRACVGKNMALLEAQLILIMVTQRYRLTLVSDRNLIPIPLLTLHPATDLMMRLDLATS